MRNAMSSPRRGCFHETSKREADASPRFATLRHASPRFATLRAEDRASPRSEPPSPPHRAPRPPPALARVGSPPPRPHDPPPTTAARRTTPQVVHPIPPLYDLRRDRIRPRAARGEPPIHKCCCEAIARRSRSDDVVVELCYWFCDVAFARIFRAFDADCDSLLSDGELNTFQARGTSLIGALNQFDEVALMSILVKFTGKPSKL